jgi:hypothetical protein
MHLKNGRSVVHKCGRRLLRGWWWPVGPKLVFDQMAAPVSEIMDGPLYVSKIVCYTNVVA